MGILRHARDSRGQSLVELALALPVLVLIVVAIAQFAIAYNSWQRLTDAVRVGGRAAATQVDAATACTNGTSAATTNWSTPTYTCDQNQTIAGATGNDPAVKLTGTTPFSIDILGIVVYSGNLSSSTVERLG